MLFLSTETMANKNRRSFFIASKNTSHNIKFHVQLHMSVFVHTCILDKYNKKENYCRHTTICFMLKILQNTYIYSNIHELNYLIKNKNENTLDELRTIPNVYSMLLL